MVFWFTKNSLFDVTSMWLTHKLHVGRFPDSAVPPAAPRLDTLSREDRSRPIMGCLWVLSPTRKESSYSDQTLTFTSHPPKNSEVCPSNRVSAAAMTSRVRLKMVTLQLFFQSVRAKDLSAPLYKQRWTEHVTSHHKPDRYATEPVTVAFCFVVGGHWAFGAKHCLHLQCTYDRVTCYIVLLATVLISGTYGEIWI